MVGFLVTLLAIFLAYKAIILISIAAFLAIALNTPVSGIAKRLPSRSRVGATALAYILVMGGLLTFLFFAVPIIVDQLAHFIKTLPSVIEEITRQSKWIHDLVAKYGLEQQYNDTLQNLQHQATQAASNAGGSFVSSLGSIVEAFTSTLLVVVMTFLMLVEGPTWIKRLWGLYGNENRRDHHRKIFSGMYKVITGYINGQVVISAISSICALVVIIILATLFDLPANLAVPIAFILFIAGLIPMFGATIGAIIAALLIGINDVGAAVIFLVYYFVYQQIENNFISPTVQSKTVEISALTVIIALTVGITLFGILGGLISIPIAGCIRVLVNDYLERNKASHLASHKA
jgi:predicted PurR-regulated permease PerM